MDIREELKVKVKAKYNSVYQFSKLIDMDYWKVNRMLNGETGSYEDLVDLSDKIEATEAPKHLKNIAIPSSERQRIREAIFMQYGTSVSFCEQNPDFDPPYISRIIKEQTTRRTDRYISLLKKLNINEPRN